MRVLVACEFSGIVRDAFRGQGHYAMSADFLDTEQPGPHYKGDVLDVLDSSWDLMVAHPPCTYLANSGVRWLHEQLGRWEAMEEAARFFWLLLNAPIPRICVENPTMHKYAVRVIGRNYDQAIQPWQFGHDASKRAGLWLKNLPPLESSQIVSKNRYSNQTPSGQNKLGPSESRGKERSRFYTGIAEAMADQWSLDSDGLSM